ncbi:MAG: TetR/AcrR family transcriptional regulator [Salibacteraceae bacterium]
MHNSVPKVAIQVNENIYLKNPESSELGKRIIAGSIDLIEELGFESFTFRKLAKSLDSTEASIYRYFESKHRLLLYLTVWYWAWMEYRLVFRIANIESPVERLKRAVSLLTEQVEEDGSFRHINETKLNRIVICESSKSYLTKAVDRENKEGVFLDYKSLVGRISEIIKEINPQYKYPHMLISTVMEGAHLQRFFAEHLPRLTDQIEGEDAIADFYSEMVLKAIS